jgi:hypothetical protein
MFLYTWGFFLTSAEFTEFGEFFNHALYYSAPSAPPRRKLWLIRPVADPRCNLRAWSTESRRPLILVELTRSHIGSRIDQGMLFLH